jgi:hypothetical protein
VSHRSVNSIKGDFAYKEVNNALLATHTSGPSDVPRCGALSLFQEPLHYRGDPAETAAPLNV